MRITPKPVAQYLWHLRPFFWNQRRKYGEFLESAMLWARAPRLFLGVAFLYGMIDRRSSPLEAASDSLLGLGKMGDLKRRLLFLLGALVVFRIGSYIPVPGIDPFGRAAPA